MEWESVVQILLSATAILIYEIVVFCILLGLVIHTLRVRKRRKKEIQNYKESEKKTMLDRALTNEKRGGSL